MTVTQRTTSNVTLNADPDDKKHHYEAKKWQEENSKALESLNRFHDEHGCFSDKYRTF
ncbi:TPA: type II toxin-antitoxin system CcdA family antitoxin [Proteus mirabilis]